MIEAVEEIMIIQKQKAIDQKIKFFATYIDIQNGLNFGNHSPMIVTDRARLMQVLLALQSNALKFTQQGKVEFNAPLVVAPPTYNIVDELKEEGDWEVLQKYS